MQEKLEGLCEWLKNEKGIAEIDMMDLIDFMPEYEEWLDNQKKWTSTSIKCDFCSHKWIATHHIETNRLECPNCKNYTPF